MGAGGDLEAVGEGKERWSKSGPYLDSGADGSRSWLTGRGWREDLRWRRGSGPTNQVGRGGAETGTAEEEWVSGRIKRSTWDTLRYSRGLKWRCQIQSWIHESVAQARLRLETEMWESPAYIQCM